MELARAQLSVKVCTPDPESTVAPEICMQPSSAEVVHVLSVPPVWQSPTAGSQQHASKVNVGQLV